MVYDMPISDVWIIVVGQPLIFPPITAKWLCWHCSEGLSMKIIFLKPIKTSLNRIHIVNKPAAPQGAALYDRRGWTLNGWGKYGHNIQAGFSSKFGLWLISWHSIGFWHRMNVV